ncbi:ABC transporter substrate-binding protein [Paenibacillus dakarensis]|uniref:ABC transporter substrate-binding protein n=1 Tax=Paenibacillus dakarensis TaxID=1527293 RepID=UPI0006D55895|nr:sugar ABC transporter substrate-binding protein [Paenibacillus dakarensis]
MKKKSWITLLSLLLVVSLLAACGGKQEPGADGASGKAGSKQKLLLWMPPFGTEETLDKETWSSILKPFEQENNVQVEIEIVPWGNYEEKYLTGISSGQGPDIGYMYMEMMSDFIDMGALEPFDSYLTDKDRENFHYLDKGLIQGKQYALPIVVGSARVLFYNKDILTKAGVEQPPATWDEFIAASKKVKDAGFTPIQMQWGDKAIGALNSTFYPFLWQAGGNLFSEDGTKAAFNSPEGIRAATFVYNLKKEGYLPDSTTSMSEPQAIGEFKSGKTAFSIAPTNQGQEFTKANINWGYLTSLKDRQQGTFAAADSLVMVSSSKNKELAAKLALYMLSGPSMTEFHKMAPFPPVGKDETYQDDDAFKRIYEEDQNMLMTLPAVKGSAGIFDNLYKNLQLMMMGELTPEEALNESAKYADEMLSQNNK